MSIEKRPEISQPELQEERLRILGEEDLQPWIERVSALGELMNAHPNAEHLLTLYPSQTPVTRERLLAEACAIGEHLGRRALLLEDMAVWMSPTLIRKSDAWEPRVVGLDWYDGLTGIAFFLGYLGQITGEQQYTTLARLAVQSIHFKLIQYTNRSKKPGATLFMALRSVIYLLTHLGALWKDEAVLREAEILAEQLPALIAQDRQLDIISGTAGAIIALLGLHTLLPSPRLIEVAQHGGEHLLAQARQMKQGWGWYTIADSPPLTGFSHGAAGIAYSLFWLASASNDPRFYTMALEGLAYERSYFSVEKQNWPDLRYIGQSESQIANAPLYYHHHWCHGAPGIGLARLASLPYHQDALIHNEIKAALKVTRAESFGHNHSLCHGDFGNLEILLMASRTIDPSYTEVVEQITAMLLDSIKAHGWVSGAPLGIETPGLMKGLAGTGYQLLRLAEPERVPAVLCFAPPV